MKNTQMRRILRMDTVVCFTLLAFQLFGNNISLIRNWGNDVVDPMAVYFMVMMLWIILFEHRAPMSLCFATALLAAYTFETLQYFHVQVWVFPVGTFDPLDLVAYLIGDILAVEIDIWFIR